MTILDGSSARRPRARTHREQTVSDHRIIRERASSDSDRTDVQEREPNRIVACNHRQVDERPFSTLAVDLRHRRSFGLLSTRAVVGGRGRRELNCDGQAAVIARAGGRRATMDCRD
jgi:hypothetical protein